MSASGSGPRGLGRLLLAGCLGLALAGMGAAFPTAAAAAPKYSNFLKAKEAECDLLGGEWIAVETQAGGVLYICRYGGKTVWVCNQSSCTVVQNKSVEGSSSPSGPTVADLQQVAARR